MNVRKGNFTIDYVPPDGVLDEGEGLEDDGHIGVEDPVGVDLFRFSILRFRALQGPILRFSS